MNGQRIESELNRALVQLNSEQQQALALRWIARVAVDLHEPRIETLLTLLRSGGGESTAQAAQLARTLVVDSHTRCGSDGDWMLQAVYFIARALEALAATSSRTASDRAVRVAQNCRMAANCRLIAQELEQSGAELEAQWQIYQAFMAEQQ